MDRFRLSSGLYPNVLMISVSAATAVFSGSISTATSNHGVGGFFCADIFPATMIGWLAMQTSEANGS